MKRKDTERSLLHAPNLAHTVLGHTVLGTRALCSQQPMRNQKEGGRVEFANLEELPGVTPAIVRCQI